MVKPVLKFKLEYVCMYNMQMNSYSFNHTKSCRTVSALCVYIESLKIHYHVFIITVRFHSLNRYFFALSIYRTKNKNRKKMYFAILQPHIATTVLIQVQAPFIYSNNIRVKIQ